MRVILEQLVFQVMYFTDWSLITVSRNGLYDDVPMIMKVFPNL